jgi:hypothetical protein
MARTLDDRVLDKLLPEYTGFVSRPNDIVKSFDDFSTDTIRTIPRGSDGKIYITNKTEDATVPVELQAAQPIDIANYNEVLNTEFTFFTPPADSSRFENGTFLREVVGNLDPHDDNFIVYFKESGYIREIPNYQTLEVMLSEREITYDSIDVVNRGELANEKIGFILADRSNEYDNIIRYKSGYRPLAKRSQTIQEKFTEKFEGKLVSWGYSVPDTMRVLIRGVWRPLFIKNTTWNSSQLGADQFANMLSVIQLYSQINALPSFEIDGLLGTPIISIEGQLALIGDTRPPQEAGITSPRAISYAELTRIFASGRSGNISYANLLSYAYDLEKIRKITYPEIGSGGAWGYLPYNDTILTIEEYRDYLAEGDQFDKDWLKPYEPIGSLAYFDTVINIQTSLQVRINAALDRVNGVQVPKITNPNTPAIQIQQPGESTVTVKDDQANVTPPRPPINNGRGV